MSDDKNNEPPEKPFEIKPLPKDHPIFQRGWIVGGNFRPLRPALSIWDSLKLPAETRARLEHVLNLFEIEIEDLPGHEDRRLVLDFLSTTILLIQQRGEDWVKANKVPLMRQWDYVASL